MATKVARKAVSAAKKVDGSKKDQLQEGWVDGSPPTKPAREPEELSERELIEKTLLQRLLLVLVPKFPPKKLENLRYPELLEFFNGGSLLLQDEIQRRFEDVSP